MKVMHRVTVTVEVNCGSGSEDELMAVEQRVQEVLDRYAKRLDAVAGVDVGTVYEREKT